jgi:hypothetical protein
MLLAGAMGVQQKLAASELEITGPIAEVSPDHWLVAALPRSGGVHAIHGAGPHACGLGSVTAAHDANAVERVIVGGPSFGGSKVVTRLGVVAIQAGAEHVGLKLALIGESPRTAVGAAADLQSHTLSRSFFGPRCG